MPLGRNLVDAVRVAASWALVLSVLVGPLGLGPFVASSAAKTCGVSCSCDEAHPERHGAPVSNDAGGILSAVPSGLHERPLCDDDCPDDCPDCACCPGITVSLAAVATATAPATTTSATLPIPPNAPANGEVTGVFRPPRFLS